MRRVGAILALGLCVAAATVASPTAASAQRYKYGFIDRTGAVIIEPEWDSVGVFIHGTAVVKVLDWYGLIDASGQLFVLATYEAVKSAPSGAVLFGRASSGKYVALDSTGAVMREYDLDRLRYPQLLVFGFSNGFATFYFDPPRPDGKEQSQSRWGWVSESGTITLAPEGLGLSSDGFGDRGWISFRDRKTGRWGFLDTTATIVVPPTLDYSSVGSFRDGRALVSKDARRYGAIDFRLREVVPLRERRIQGFHQGRALLAGSLVDTAGRPVNRVDYATLFDYREGIGTAKTGSGSGRLVNGRGETIYEGPRSPSAYVGDSLYVLTPQHGNIDVNQTLMRFDGTVVADSLKVAVLGPLSEGLIAVRRETDASIEARIAEARKEREEVERERERQRRFANVRPASPSAGPDPGKVRYVYYIVRQSMKSFARDVSVMGGSKMRMTGYNLYVDYGYIDVAPGTAAQTLGRLHSPPHRALTITAGEGVFPYEAGKEVTAEAMRLSGIGRGPADRLSTSFIGVISR